MTVALILTTLVVLLLLVVSELWWRSRKPQDEFSRKFVHITVGSFAAFWPYFLSWNQILLLSAAFIGAVLVSQYYGIFTAIHAVERPTWGEICFAVAIGALALLTKMPAIYAVAVLHMGLADGVAALVGKAYGAQNSYKILGHVKSLAGSLAFLAISLTLLIGYASIAPTAINGLLLAALALGATALENFSVRGVDNLLVPVLIGVVLTAVR